MSYPQPGDLLRIRSTGETVRLVRLDLARGLATVTSSAGRIGTRAVPLRDLAPADAWAMNCA